MKNIKKSLLIATTLLMVMLTFPSVFATWVAFNYEQDLYDDDYWEEAQVDQSIWDWWSMPYNSYASIHTSDPDEDGTIGVYAQSHWFNENWTILFEPVLLDTQTRLTTISKIDTWNDTYEDARAYPYVSIWIMYAYETGDESLQYAEIQIFLAQKGDAVHTPNQTTKTTIDNLGVERYLIQHRIASDIAVGTLSYREIDLYSLTSILEDYWGCDPEIGGITGIAFGNYVYKIYMQTTWDYVCLEKDV